MAYISRDFLGMSFSARDFRAGTLENNFKLQTCMDGIGRGYLLWKM